MLQLPFEDVHMQRCVGRVSGVQGTRWRLGAAVHMGGVCVARCGGMWACASFTA